MYGDCYSHHARERSSHHFLFVPFCKAVRERRTVMAKNYYLILGVDSNATPEQNKSAYRRQVMDFLPDHYGENCEPFLAIQEAHAVLNDPIRRRAYDLLLHKRPFPHFHSGITSSSFPCCWPYSFCSLPKSNHGRNFPIKLSRTKSLPARWCRW